MAITSNNNAVVKEARIIVNANPIGTAWRRYWHSSNVAFIGIVSALMIWLFPGFSSLIFFVAGGMLWLHLTMAVRYPLRIPMSSNIKSDANNFAPGKESGGAAPNAITCLGVDVETGRQVFENSDRERQHFVILATTGSGKTYGLRFHLAMAITQTTGAIVIDGKGDIEFPLDSVSLIRRFARDDDIRILNFKQGNENVYAETGTPLTNTFNPLAVGSSSYISEVLKALLSDDDPGASKGDMWQKRAESMCDNIAKMATYKRDHSDFKIRPGTIASMLELRELCKIHVDPSIPSVFKSTLEIYFRTLPDFEISHTKAYAEGEEFKGKILEQHGYVAMQLQPALTVLEDRYGRIFDTDNPEIDLKDIVINNRILMVLLPAMEQSTGTTRQTGKIILAALKGMIAGELGAKFQGNIDDILSERACSDPAPFKVFLDECGYYAMINGIEILPAQGRGLGFAFYFIGQTYTDLEKAGKEIAEIIWGNANSKQAGKTESKETYQKFADRLQQVDVTTVDRQDIEDGPMGGQSIRNSNSLSISRRERLEMKDLTRLREGQFFHINGSDLIEIRTGDPVIKDKVKEVRYIQLVGLGPIPKAVQREIGQSFPKAMAFFKNNALGKQQHQIKMDSLPVLRDCLAQFKEYESRGMLAKTDRPNLWLKAITDALTQSQSESQSEREQQIAAMLNKSQMAPQKNDQQSSPQLSTAQTTVGHDEQALDSVHVSNWMDFVDEAADEYEADQQRSVGHTNVEEYEVDDDFGYDDEEIELAGDVSDDDFGGEDDLEEVSEFDVEKEHLEYQLQTGELTQAEFEQDLLALQQEFGLTPESEFNQPSAVQTPVSAPLDQPEVPTTAISVEADNGDTITSGEPPTDTYPSQASERLAKESTKSDLEELIDELETQYDYTKI